MPMKLENVGNGAAIDFMVGLHHENSERGSSKYILPHHLKVGDSFYIQVFIDDTKQQETGENGT